MRYYYKSKDSKAIYSVKSPMLDENLISITEEEYRILAMATEPTAEQLAEAERLKQISLLKAQLAATDYQAIKYAEGMMSEEEYAPIKAQRQAWRDEINQLEKDS